MNAAFLHFENCRVDTINSLSKFHTTVDVLRLDLLHPVVSGNKWFKLKNYLNEAQLSNKKTIVTFGGAYSNHIAATAVATKALGLKSVAMIRGEKPNLLSHTLQDALHHGMELYFVSREDYKNKKLPAEFFWKRQKDEFCFINEGGYGAKGVEGAKEILQLVDAFRYTHIVAAAGTGTTVAGLTEASFPRQKIIGISVLKNNFSLSQQVENLISKENKKNFMLLHDYHFGGYAKYSKELIDFMNEWFLQTNIPSDFVYTGKLFYAANDLIRKNFFEEGSKLLIIHSGGLQGNNSLPQGTLIF